MDRSTVVRPAGAAGHDAAVSSTVRQADEAAERGEYTTALSWLDMLRAIGDELPYGYEYKRRTWRAARCPGR
jgi:hypothetical protein